MSRGKVVLKLCPVCQYRPRARCRGNGLRATCGAMTCIKKRRIQTGQSGDLGRYGERPMPESVRFPTGPGLCDQCHGATYDMTYDGVAYRGCERCHWEVRTTPLARPAGWHVPKIRPAPSEAFLAQAGNHRGNRDATGRFLSSATIEKMRQGGKKGAAASPHRDHLFKGQR